MITLGDAVEGNYEVSIISATNLFEWSANVKRRCCRWFSMFIPTSALQMPITATLKFAPPLSLPPPLPRVPKKFPWPLQSEAEEAKSLVCYDKDRAWSKSGISGPVIIWALATNIPKIAQIET